ncbi:dihydrolipoamide s-acetyltransferase protein [Parvularcula bermudensis HTCC2503]|uniref:Acetyltransferase component of pyruvate dehydrogenase complex n=1 Tax=Parvularcula bermudensis (strain ATCC BAA-594 / HTCC2503 / KCTC 12087) TaxID=314260 RepID=E0TC32_PARBH|nr:pyruvate dehydrogenase complex dihydrolipoamide acetyltransferase [Parvularcula bermudensis]ADM09825.1 dihydrolipoamide s-acetyltransferase protein [Parvularcula bermudensis HTCC2503]
MPMPILMPALSPTMEEGTLAKWMVAEGDKISSGDVIAEIETDKATMEVEAVDDGIVGKILVESGTEAVKVNQMIGVLLEEGESADDIDLEALRSSVPTDAGEDNGAAKKDAAQSSKEATSPPKESPSESQEPSADRSAPSPTSTPSGSQSSSADAKAEGERLFASPLARRIAEQEGLSLPLIEGTGPRGRIVKRDVEKALEEGQAQPDGKGAVAGAGGGLDPRLYSPETYTAIKNDGMRKTIAKRLNQSFNQEVPHFPLNIDIDLTQLLAARERINAASPEKGSEGTYKISVNDFIVKASAQALMVVPGANASFTEEAILRHHHADIGVAVAIDGGLITPIVWRAETKGLQAISEEIRDLAGRARDKKLKPEEYQGGTFAVSNLGMFGIKSFASIVNTPHGAILSVGAGEDRPVVRNGEIVVRPIMTVTLTCDHRVVDGATGAEFLAAFKRFCEEPASMLL